jgi:hypothetical protein
MRASRALRRWDCPMLNPPSPTTRKCEADPALGRALSRMAGSFARVLCFRGRMRGACQSSPSAWSDRKRMHLFRGRVSRRCRLTLHELDTAVLHRDLTKHALRCGDAGAAARVGCATAVEVQCVQASAQMQALTQVAVSDLRLATVADLHVVPHIDPATRGAAQQRVAAPLGASTRRQAGARYETGAHNDGPWNCDPFAVQGRAPHVRQHAFVILCETAHVAHVRGT